MRKNNSFGAAAIALSVLLAASFFLPWLSFRREADATAQQAPQPIKDRIRDQEVFTTSAWQLARGNVSVVEDSRQLESLQEQPEFDRAAYDRMEADRQEWISQAISARPWYFLSLIPPAGFLVVGAMALVRVISPRSAGALVVALGILGLSMVIVALASVDFKSDLERMAGEQNPQAQQQDPSESMATSSKYGLWVTLVLSLAGAGVGVMGMVAGKSSARPVRRGSPDSTKAPAPPQPGGSGNTPPTE